jgi:DNA-binding transcriptional regulator PaaX
MDKKTFLQKYPVILHELITSPSVFREAFLSSQNLPYPCMGHIRDICEYASISYGALRTSLSRLIKANEIDFFYDENKTKRFKLTSAQQSVSKVLMDDTGSEKGFSIAIFSFTTEQEKERRDARILLEGCGFKLFAQNSYIRRKINKEYFEKSIKEYGLSRNLFVFDCSDPGTEEFRARLFSQFEMEKAVKLTNTFYFDLKKFLNDELTSAEFSRRLLYAGPVYYNICYANELTVPETYFPKDYHIKELKTFFQRIPQHRWADFISYYLEIERRSKRV